MTVIDMISAAFPPVEKEIQRLFQGPGVQCITFRRGACGYGLPVIDTVTISPLGRLVSEFQRVLRRLSATDDRILALRGLDYAIEDLFHDPANLDLLRFMSVLFRASRTDEALFCSLFRTFGGVVAGGYDLTPWLQVCAGIRGEATLRTFLEESADIMESGENVSPAARETFLFFLSIWKGRLTTENVGRATDKRRYLRKRMRLSGYYHQLPYLLGSEIVIRDLSPGGFSFEVVGEHPPKTDELIQVFFVLDDYMSRGVHKLAVVKRWDGTLGGAQFYS